jgi:hypothetical protein
MATTMQTLHVPFVDLRAQYSALEKEVNRAVAKGLRKNLQSTARQSARSLWTLELRRWS